MRIVEWLKEWERARWPGTRCDFCGRFENGQLAHELCVFAGMLMCRTCLSGPKAQLALDLLYWDEHPEQVPPCKHCGKQVPAHQLDELCGWYFCDECVSDFYVRLYWERIRRRFEERRLVAHRLELKKLRKGVGTPA